MHFKILKIIATSGFLTDLEYTKFVFGRGFASDPTGGAYSAVPDPLSGLRGALLLRRRGGSGKERRGGKRKERGKEGEIPGSALECGWCGASRTTPNTNMTRKTKRYSD